MKLILCLGIMMTTTFVHAGFACFRNSLYNENGRVANYSSNATCLAALRNSVNGFICIAQSEGGAQLWSDTSKDKFVAQISSVSECQNVIKASI